MALIPWIQASEGVIAKNDVAGRPDVANRPLRTLLTQSGYDPDSGVSLPARDLSNPRGLEIIAHRGFSDAAPEDTIAAFSAAAETAHSVEMDVQFSSDGIPVILHDATVNRTSNLLGNVKDLTIAALEAGDFGAWFDATRFTGTKIPRFRDALKFCSQWARLIYPEIKGYRTTADIALMIQEIIDLGLESRCVVQSFLSSDLAIARGYSSKICLAYDSGDLPTFNAQLPLASADGNAIMFSDYNFIIANPTLVKTARAAGVDVAVWTVTTVTEVQQLIDLGVRRIASNKLISGVLSL